MRSAGSRGYHLQALATCSYDPSIIHPSGGGEPLQHIRRRRSPTPSGVYQTVGETSALRGRINAGPGDPIPNSNSAMSHLGGGGLPTVTQTFAMKVHFQQLAPGSAAQYS